jgi:hypothetical protein
LDLFAGGIQGFWSQSNTVEHYTPRYIWERAIRTMGSIDVDPASDPGYNIPASTHYTKEDNGLIQPWIGNIWLNPPYGPTVWEWFEKLQKEIDSQNTTQAVVLWKAATETKAWKTLTEIAPIICLLNRRVSFIRKRCNGGNSTFSPVVFYVGNDARAFVKAYSDIGVIWCRFIPSNKVQP